MKGKKCIALGVSAVMMFSLTACGGSMEGEQNSVESNVESAGEEEQESGKTLVIYSPQGDADRGEWFIKKCKEDTGIEIEFLCSGGGELEERLIAEKQNPQADVVFGLGQLAMNNLKREDVLTSYVPSWAEGLDEVYKDHDGMFHCFWQTPIVMAYNTDFISESEAPKTWQDLDKPEYSEMFTIGDIKSQTTRTIITGIIWDYYDEAEGDIAQEGWDKLQGIYANTQTVPSGSDQWQMVKEGSTPLVLSWYGGIVSNTEKNQIPVGYVVPEEGTPIVSEGIGIVKGTENMELAEEFVEWFGDPENMAEYANEFGQAPAHPDAIALCDEEVKADATMFKAQEIDWEVASKKMNDWLMKIELEIMP